MTSINIHVEEAVKNGKLLGVNKDCSYYPCHFDGQDCTWCFCPFYPCQDSMTEGGLTIGRLSCELVWSCEGCRWIHRPEVASLVLQKILEIIKRNGPLTHKKLLRVRRDVLEAHPP